MKTWKVKSGGKLSRIVIFYFGLGALAFLYVIEVLADESGVIILLAFFPFWLPVLLVTFSRLIKSKIPRRIEIDSQTRICKIIFSKKKIRELSFDELAFSRFEKPRRYVSLTFYKTFTGTRGQLVTKELTEIIAFKFTFSWRKEQIYEIIQELNKNNMRELEAENIELPLWERFI